MPNSALAAALAAALVIACPPAAEGGRSGPKRSVVDTIIVHAISGPDTRCPGGRLTFSGAPGNAEKWQRFFDTHPFLGIHYVVDREGRVLASTPEDRFANHALGSSATAIGIELVHNGDGVEPFPALQIDALIELLKSIRSRHAIPLEAIKGHADVDTRTFTCGGRIYKTKLDPGANFPWLKVLTALAAPPRLLSGPVPAVRPKPPFALKGPPVKAR